MENIALIIDKETAKKIVNAQFPTLILSGLIGLITCMYWGIKDLRPELQLYAIIISLCLSIIGFIWIYKTRLKILSQTKIELYQSKKNLIESYNGKTKIVELKDNFKIQNSESGIAIKNNRKTIVISKKIKGSQEIINIIKTYR